MTTKSSLQQEPAPEIQGNLKTKVHLGLVASGVNIFALSSPKVDFSPEAGRWRCVWPANHGPLKSKSVGSSNSQRN